MPSLQDALVSTAKAELQLVSGRKETDPTLRSTLVKYWTEGPQKLTGDQTQKNKLRKMADRQIDDRIAWSAAFISYIMRGAVAASGCTADFAFSASHSKYAGASIRNGLGGAAAPAFIGYPPTGPGSVPPKVGDLVGVTRVKWVDDFADALDAARRDETYFSHFDVVTDVSDGYASRIGGNVSDSVTSTKIKLSDGFLPILPFKYDAAGRVTSGPFICVIRLKE